MKRQDYFKTITFLSHFSFLFILLSFLAPNRLEGQSDLEDDGAIHRVDYNGTYQDYIIPSNTSATKISISMRGADGGNRTVDEWGQDCRFGGGEGAFVSGSFDIGYGANELAPGTTLRFIVGEKGASRNSNNVDGAGGGGGTGLLAYINGEWEILLVAGGGGGAACNGVCEGGNGRGGSTNTWGKNGAGSHQGEGGSNGGGGENGGISNDRSAGGGGHSGNGQDANKDTGCSGSGGRKGGTTGGAGGTGSGANCTALPDDYKDGGFGFGGGGTGYFAGGGGGGYSGGGGGASTGVSGGGPGGGGGSYVNETYAVSSNITEGGSKDHPENGYMAYYTTCQNSLLGVEEDCSRGPLLVTVLAESACFTSIELSGSGGAYASSSPIFENIQPGDYTVTMTGKNLQGATIILDQIDVTILGDIEPPTALCKGGTTEVIVDEDFVLNSVIEQIDDGSYDDCLIEDIILGSGQSDEIDICLAGPQKVTLTVRDLMGKEGICTTRVEFIDNILPVALCKAVTLQLDDNGEARLRANDVDDGSYDNCGLEAKQIRVNGGDLKNSYDFDCSDVGSHSVEFFVRDDVQWTNCYTSVKIERQEPLDMLCFANYVSLDETGTATITPQDLTIIFNDNCSTVDHFNMILEKETFDCSDIGTDHQFSIVAITPSGEQAGCLTSMTVIQPTPPQINCKDVTVALDEHGEAQISKADLFESASGVCLSEAEIFAAIYSGVDFDQEIFTCEDLGEQTVSLNYVHNSGANAQVVFCNSTVEIIENTAPTALCQDVIVYLDANNEAVVAAEAVDNGSSDLCGGVSLSLSPTNFNCVHIGSNEATLTVTDEEGNEDSCLANVQVQVENPAPTALCQDVTIFIQNDGLAQTTAEAVDNGSYDECGNISLSLSQTEFTCEERGYNDVLLTATDEEGYESSCAATVRVLKVAPIARCQDVTVQLDANGQASITAAAVDDGSSDACAISSMSLSKTNFTCSNIGMNTISLFIRDDGFYEDQCNAIVWVEDITAPAASCQDVTLQLDANGLASTTPEAVDNGSFDACGIVLLSLNQTDFSCSDIGANEVILTLADESGNESSCTAKVEVEDALEPTALCRDITIQLNAQGQASITAEAVDNASSDNCAIASLQLSRTNFNCAHLGANEVGLTVSDFSGNEDHCTANIWVEDTTAPEAICQDITIQLDAQEQASTTAEAVDGGSSDNCGIASRNLSQTNFTCSDIDSHEVTLTLVDGSGNESSCTAMIQVEDVLAPTALCQDITIQLDAEGQGTTTAEAVDGGSSDACGIASLSLDQTDFSCDNVGANDVRLTVVDLNGNESDCTAEVWVEDTTPPESICQDITIQLDANGLGSVSASAVDNGSTDACGIASLSLDQTDFSCDDVGANDVLLTLVDLNGNESECAAKIWVEDTTAPEAICQDITVQLDANGQASTTAEVVDNASFDACGIASLSLDQTDFSCDDVGANDVLLTIVDLNGNESECTAKVWVEDTTPPEALCHGIDVSLDASGFASIGSAAINAGSSDNCGIASYSLSQRQFNCAEDGVSVNVTLTLTDLSGNENSCSARVRLVDNNSPIALCQDVSVQLNDQGTGSIKISDVDAGSSDACGTIYKALVRRDFYCDDIGLASTSLIITDGSGNQSSCTANVWVEDAGLPRALCQDVTIQLDANGQGSTTAEAVDDGSNDACGTISFSLNQTDFTCSDMGGKEVVLTVVDEVGNENSCTANVWLEDMAPPEALCRDITIQLDANGQGSVAAEAVDNGSSDACGTISLSLSQTGFTCSDIGANFVELTATDQNGNQSSCDANVFVEDRIEPSITPAANAKLWPPDYSYQTFMIEDMVAELSDNCGADISLDNVWIHQATSDEAEDDPSTQDGNTLNDIVISADCQSVQVRKERMGGGNGRCYTVTLAIQDAGGNSSYADYLITIPKWAWGWNSDAVIDDPVYVVNCSSSGATSATLKEQIAFTQLNSRANDGKQWLAVYPNPFHSQTTIEFNLLEATFVSLEVFDLQGRRVRRLLSKNGTAGNHQLQWDGTDAGGHTLNSGLYLLRLQIGEAVLVKKVALQGR